MIQAGDDILCSQINKLINSIWNKEELPKQWKESIIASIYKKGNTVVIIAAWHSDQLPTKLYTIILLSRLSPHIHEITGVHQCHFNITDQLLISTFFCFQILKKKLLVHSASPIHRIQECLQFR
jgi:hypothetical protein